MSKRQTTGLPDKNKTNATKPITEKSRLETTIDRILGNPQNLQERETAINRVLTRIVAVTVVIVAILIGISVIYSQIYEPNIAVATVNGENISVGQFRDQVRFERARITELVNSAAQQLQQFGMDVNQYLSNQEPYKTYLNELNFPDQLGSRVLDDMIAIKLTQQEAKKLNITVNQEQVQEQINNFFGYDPTRVALTGAEPTATLTPTITPTPFVSPTPTPTQTATPLPSPTLEQTAELTAEATVDVTATPTDFPTSTPEPTKSIEEQQKEFTDTIDTYSRNLRQQTGIGQNIIDDYYSNLAYQEAIGQYLLDQGEGKVTYVALRHILVATEEEALDVIASLNAGESFADLALAVSTDGGSSSNGGFYDFAPATNYVKEFKDASLTLEIGVISTPIKTEFGYHVMQVIAREDREVKEDEQDGVKRALYGEWLDNLKTTNEANIVKNDNWVNYIPTN
jgi:parvulin-like peptidyl-prolyl isomerase